jgi:hypothetical protein
LRRPLLTVRRTSSLLFIVDECSNKKYSIEVKGRL